MDICQVECLACMSRPHPNDPLTVVGFPIADLLYNIREGEQADELFCRFRRHIAALTISPNNSKTDAYNYLGVIIGKICMYNYSQQLAPLASVIIWYQNQPAITHTA